MTGVGIAGLVFLGMVLLFIEVVLVPGVGIVGVAGVGLLVWASATIWGTYGAIFGILSVLLSGAVVLFGTWKLSQSKLGRKMILEAQLDEENSSSSSLQHLRGKTGVTQSVMRPGGAVEIDGKRMDAVATNGQWIEAGVHIHIVDVQTNNIFVEPVKQPESDSALEEDAP